MQNAMRYVGLGLLLVVFGSFILGATGAEKSVIDATEEEVIGFIAFREELQKYSKEHEKYLHKIKEYVQNKEISTSSRNRILLEANKLGLMPFDEYHCVKHIDQNMMNLYELDRNEPFMIILKDMDWNGAKAVISNIGWDRTDAEIEKSAELLVYTMGTEITLLIIDNQLTYMDGPNPKEEDILPRQVTTDPRLHSGRRGAGSILSLSGADVAFGVTL